MTGSRKNKDVSSQPEWSVTLLKLICSSSYWVSSLGKGALEVDGICMCPKFIDELGKPPQTEVVCLSKTMCEED